MLLSTTCTIPSLPPSPHFHSLHNQSKHIAPKNLKQPITARTSAKQSLFYFNMYLRHYVNSGSMSDAQKLFDQMRERTLISWTILMSGYARHGPVLEVLFMFRDILLYENSELLHPDSFVFSIVLRSCADLGNLRYGRGIHVHLLKRYGVVDSFVENALLNMYTSCRCLIDADIVFDGIEKPDLVAWGTMLNGYVKNGDDKKALSSFLVMLENEVKPDTFLLSTVIGACRNLECVDFGTQIHCYIIKMELACHLFIENTLMDFYARCGDLEGMRLIFDMICEKNLVSWNTLITGYVKNYYYSEALRLFQALIHEVNQFDDITLTSIIEAIISLGNIEHGRELHGYIIRMGVGSNHRVVTSILDMYIEFNDHRSSLYLRDTIPLNLFNLLEGAQLDEFIIASMLKWYSMKGDLKNGMVLHSLIIKLEMLPDPYLVNCLIYLYSNCRIFEASERVFLRAHDLGIASWSALISGYSYNGWFSEALVWFAEMALGSIKADEFIFTSVLFACLGMENLRKAREIHCKVLRSGYESKVSVINMLINLYSELWHHKHALNLCCSILDVEVEWKMLIKSCLKSKDYEMVMVHKILRRIQVSFASISPESISDILSSCSCPVFLNVGKQAHAYLMKRGLLISYPSITNSLITMYSSCGNMSDAIQIFDEMPEKNHVSWSSVISARVDHGHPSEALDLFVQNGWKSNLTYSNTIISILKACSQMGLIADAFRLLYSMEKVFGIKPSERHYSCMVEVLGRAGKFEEALEFIDDIPPTESGPLIWRALLSSCRIHGNMKLAKYSIDKLLELEPNDFFANLLLEQIVLTSGQWDYALKLKTKNKITRSSSSWIAIQNKIYEFGSNHSITAEVHAKIAELERTMMEMEYVADRNHLLHSAEEEEYDGVGLHHTEMKALAFGLVFLPCGIPVRVVKSVRMCGECHSACKFISTFIDREVIIKDPCRFHHFRDGKCSCRDKW